MLVHYMRSVVFACVLLLAVGMVSAASPDVSGTYRPVTGGYMVEFQVHNSAGGDPIWQWTLATADASAVSSPSGWHAQQSFRDITWDADTPDALIQPSASLGGFSFTSAAQPGTLRWLVHAGAAGDYLGSVTPQPVPEPSALLVLVGGLGVLGLPVLRRRR